MKLSCRIAGHQWDGCKCTRCGELRDAEHHWTGCKCSVCGKIRDAQHIWEGIPCHLCHGEKRSQFCKSLSCAQSRQGAWIIASIEKNCLQKCKSCGKIKTGNHEMSSIAHKCYQECLNCGFRSQPVHTWEGCICSICGEQRDKKHEWIKNGCKEQCAICGKTREDDSLHNWIRNGCQEQCNICGKKRESHDFQLIHTEIEYGSGKCSTVYANDDYACNFCKTPNACLKYPQTNKELHRCSRCGFEKWYTYRQ